MAIVGTLTCTIVEERVGNKDLCKSKELLSQIPFSQIRNLLDESSVGVVSLPENENNVMSKPNNLFEYMITGLPVIESNFPI